MMRIALLPSQLCRRLDFHMGADYFVFSSHSQECRTLWKYCCKCMYISISTEDVARDLWESYEFSLHKFSCAVWLV